ncbi:MAG TPA: S-adenosylmethionine:tRNA ribosyltransferase-isomerase [Polyangiaceae bacterium]|jgi:S-adenosylmethionine:tRNA ribosyltransferase-isomerase|nr:S-adenosylmethionine:tRNA ribosyltransferase-isomerase [Polyangiaceae bacterium]
MKAATLPRSEPNRERLLVVDPERDTFADFSIADLPQFLGPGDAVVLNDAATLPASLRADEELELRLMSELEDGTWLALTLGRGDSRVPTEARGSPRPLSRGEQLDFGSGLRACVISVEPESSSRFVRIVFEQTGSALWQALYRAARPIQYSYLARPLALWDVQNAFASRPWAFEPPSAAKPLTFETLFGLEARGAILAHLTHAAGISSTGDSALDRRLPLGERYEISVATATLVNETLARGASVLAVGTSVTRALEAAARGGRVQPGSERTSLLLGPSSKLQICSGLLTGLHEPGTSHYSLLEAFASRGLLDRSFAHAEAQGYLQHEFGDSCLILAGALRDQLRAKQAA